MSQPTNLSGRRPSTEQEALLAAAAEHWRKTGNEAPVQAIARVEEAAKQLVALKHWARPISKALNLDDGRLTFHVLEAPDPANAIIEFAQRNHADHIVMGARGSSSLRRLLGSVSSQVVAQSDCTVTVVRAGVPLDEPRPAPTPAANGPAGG